MITRHEFITLLGGAAAGWPVVARAQQPTMAVIGFLSTETADISADRLDGFRRGLSEMGFVEGMNARIEYRWAAGRYAHLPELAADLVRSRPAVIHTAANGPAALAAKLSTREIPIVFVAGVDPVEAGLVDSLSRPGGNITGVTSLNVELAPKRLEILNQLKPASTAIALLVNPANEYSAAIQTTVVQEAAQKLGRPLMVFRAVSEDQIKAVFADLARQQVQSLLIGADTLFTGLSARLAQLAIRFKILTIYHSHQFATAGGLLSYGGSFAELHRLAGIYVGRILKGEAVSTLPVQQLAKVELIVNLRTARLLGLTVPEPLLARADEVIE